MLPTTLIDLDLQTWLALAIVAQLAPGLLLSIDIAQWLMLRRLVRPAWWRIPATVTAWLVALTQRSSHLRPSGRGDAPLHTVSWVTAGLEMASICVAATAMTIAMLPHDHGVCMVRGRFYR